MSVLKHVFILYNCQQKKSAHERAKDHYASGEWSSGQKWADDAPKDEVAPESVTLMNMGACGAFVHGTEDEFLGNRDVRDITSTHLFVLLN